MTDPEEHHFRHGRRILDAIANRHRCFADGTMRIRMHERSVVVERNGGQAFLTMVEERAWQRGEQDQCQEQAGCGSGPGPQHRPEGTGFPDPPGPGSGRTDPKAKTATFGAMDTHAPNRSNVKHLGLLTSGGDAPGMNAAIRAVVRTAHYHGLRVSGILEGFKGLVDDDVRPLGPRDVSNIIQRGGTILRSARCEAFRSSAGREQAQRTMREHGMDALVVIGGDGTFRGAQVFMDEHGIPVVGITGTIDNDMAGTDSTIGFDTATNTALDLVDRIRDTASSHDRLFFVEVMGRSSGAIALHCGVAAGAEFVMIPEMKQGIEELISVLERTEKTKSSVIVIVAEGDEEGGAYAVARKVKERYAHYDTRVSILGHVQRGGSPSVADRLLASRSGVAAVEALLDAASGVMVGQVAGRMVLTPFSEALARSDRADPELLRILSILSV